MKDKKLIIVIVILIFAFFVIFYFNKQKNEGVDAINKVLNIDTITASDNVSDIDYSKLKKFDIELTETLKIKTGGVYNLTGTIIDGQIYIDTKDSVKLILNNVNITSKNGPAIMIENANQVYIELASDSVNYLTDDSNYKVDLEGEPNATIFSKDDLILDGSGKLVISANYQDGIVSKDNLKIIAGTYEIKSVDDAIRGKDSLVIINGNFDINSFGDGLKSTNSNDNKLGYTLIENGEFNIVTTNDGIQAETDLVINGGNFNIKTGDGSSNSSLENANWGKWGEPFKNNDSVKSKETDSAKGLKATNNIVISNGTFIIDSSDDSIHSNENVGISNGNFTINSGDDGIHADSSLIIDGGSIVIQKSYEGLEAESITINDGTINITSSDDGINAASSNDDSVINNRPGMNNFENWGNSKIQINGGNILVDASGDGLDANGSIYMNGGIVVVNGPVDGGNGAIDYDGEFKITAGTLLASGASGMAQGISNSSTQNAVIINFSKNINEDELISIFDSNDLEILTYKSNKRYQNLVISTSNIKSNEKYTIYTGGNSISGEVNGLYTVGSYKDGSEYTTFITNNIITNIGNNSGFNQGMNMGPNGPGRRP